MFSLIYRNPNAAPCNPPNKLLNELVFKQTPTSYRIFFDYYRNTGKVKDNVKRVKVQLLNTRYAGETLKHELMLHFNRVKDILTENGFEPRFGKLDFENQYMSFIFNYQASTPPYVEFQLTGRDRMSKDVVVRTYSLICPARTTNEDILRAAIQQSVFSVDTDRLYICEDRKSMSVVTSPEFVK